MNDDKHKGPQVVVIGTGRANMDMLAPGAESVPITDPVSKTPDVVGEHGKAWLCDSEAGRKIMGVSRDEDGSLAQWIVEAPWAHPVWHSYSIVLVHLRPLVNGGKTLFYLDDATHEVWLHAMDPEKDRNPVIESGILKGHWLHPSNFASQFIEITDDLALARVRNAVQMICDGKLSPDTDHESAWVALFGDSMMKDRPGRRPPKER